MKKMGIVAAAFLSVFGTFQIATADSYLTPPNPQRDPKGSDIHMAYESDTFIPGRPATQLPGAHLNGPGDTYRQTFFIDDEYIGNPEYEILLATAAVHIDDYDYKEGKDTAQEWGTILINGSPMKYTVLGGKFPEGTSDLMEMISDAEISGEKGPLQPPYIFNITDVLKDGAQKIVFEVTNLDKNGSQEGEVDFGDFVVNRTGIHIYYKKINS